ncbi:chromosome alignment-maintaining phosphoprotein 1-like [Poeciliopsis prolifica]|uniref:chromosome alignment-maintaining phosphoprotein 1-like n=1 Tax=Poeciliopsis prolifica TaxID=188132 RepID=UPI002414571E|nr:chromosome alignment-maintaining phosphoprotein 1-like [Poeciliopsis prolifica]
MSVFIHTRGEAGGGVAAHLRCPHCGHLSKSHAQQLAHLAASHPTCLDDVAVGRLGNILMYQSSARLFHCSQCFHTCKDFSKLYKHIIARHCMVEKEEEGGRGGEEGQEAGGWEERRMKKNLRLATGSAPSPSATSFANTRSPRATPATPWPRAGSCRRAGPRRRTAGMSEELMKEEMEVAARWVGSVSHRFVCLVCNWKSKLKGFVLTHIERHHEVERPYRCSSCPQSFFLPSRLQQHARTAHRPGRYACPFCWFRSEVLGGFRRHCSRCSAREEEEVPGEEEEEQERKEPEPEDRKETRGWRRRSLGRRMEGGELEEEEDD